MGTKKLKDRGEVTLTFDSFRGVHFGKSNARRKRRKNEVGKGVGMKKRGRKRPTLCFEFDWSPEYQWEGRLRTGAMHRIKK